MKEKKEEDLDIEDLDKGLDKQFLIGRNISLRQNMLKMGTRVISWNMTHATNHDTTVWIGWNCSWLVAADDCRTC